MLTKKLRYQVHHSTYFDYIIFLVTLMLLFYGLFFESFKPVPQTNDSSVLILENDRPQFKVSTAVYIAPIFLITEIYGMVFLEGKPKLRSIQWTALVGLMLFKIRYKLHDGLEEYRAWIASF